MDRGSDWEALGHDALLALVPFDLYVPDMAAFPPGARPLTFPDTVRPTG